MIYSNWQSPEPNDYYPGEDYAFMTYDGTWNDAGPPGHGEIRVSYVCESYGQSSLNSLRNGLIVNLPMDEFNNETIYDLSGNYYHANNFNPKLVIGISGNALEFDGRTSYLTINPPFKLGTQKITLSAWVSYYSLYKNGWHSGIICQDDMFNDYTGDRVFQLSTSTNKIVLHRFILIEI